MSKSMVFHGTVGIGKMATFLHIANFSDMHVNSYLTIFQLVNRGYSKYRAFLALPSQIEVQLFNVIKNNKFFNYLIVII